MYLEALSVESARHVYEVHFVADFAVDLQEQLRPGDVVVVDQNVLRLYGEKLAPVLENVSSLVIDPTESQKSYQGVEPFIRDLIELGFRKNNKLIAVGGGIVQDITAFTSSVIFRGVDWVFFPTTLLAQCDSCIGSKTSINFGEYKNQLGGFYPPIKIFIDLQFLNTLPQQEIRSGIGEMLHYFLVSGEEDFERISKAYEDALKGKPVLMELVRRSLEIKKKYVESDEYDEGPRNVLNYGHSFGHALESLSGYGIPHGIAVSVGMDIANILSCLKGYITFEDYIRIRKLLCKNWKGVCLPEFEIERFFQLLKKDKKARGDEINVILTRGLGQMFRAPLPLTGDTVRLLSMYFESFRIESNEVLDLLCQLKK